MNIIRNTEFGGERPLFGSHDLRLENVIVRAGESAIKECSNIEAIECRFEGNYPFWHVHGFRIERCYFDVGGRSALWYSDHLTMKDTVIDAPKMFREMHEIDIENVTMNDADEVSGVVTVSASKTLNCMEEPIRSCSAITFMWMDWRVTASMFSSM